MTSKIRISTNSKKWQTFKGKSIEYLIYMEIAKMSSDVDVYDGSEIIINKGEAISGVDELIQMNLIEEKQILDALQFLEDAGQLKIDYLFGKGKNMIFSAQFLKYDFFTYKVVG